MLSEIPERGPPRLSCGARSRPEDVGGSASGFDYRTRRPAPSDVVRRAIRRAKIRAGGCGSALSDRVDGYAAKRWRMAALNAFSAHIRLTIPEAFAVHKATIDWEQRTARPHARPRVGAPWFLMPMMRSAMDSWERVDFFNRYLGGTVMPRMFLDWLPGLMCSAHFALIAPRPRNMPADHVAAGRATQRFWLTATRLGLQLQPLYTPLVFARFARQQRNFTVVEAAKARAKAVAARLDQIFGAEPRNGRCFWVASGQ